MLSEMWLPIQVIGFQTLQMVHWPLSLALSMFALLRTGHYDTINVLSHRNTEFRSFDAVTVSGALDPFHELERQDRALFRGLKAFQFRV